MSEMFVGGKTQAQAAGDVRKEQGRLTNNGMHRDRTDKNAVADDFDFAAARANLGKKKLSSSGSADAKVAKARAAFEAENKTPETVAPIYVAKKAGSQPVTVQQGDRLTNNGMHRDRTDKNAVSDEHNFADLKSRLKKTA